MQRGFQSFLGADAQEEEKPKPEQLLDEISVEGIARYIKSDKCEYFESDFLICVHNNYFNTMS